MVASLAACGGRMEMLARSAAATERLLAVVAAELVAELLATIDLI